ncbi:hypothetical protein ACHABQ_03085 [Nesterenkonia aurantiaca]|uniref:hypothetical protein n=1 Tax=Nesterenkonia aurantiaca TaxID=1436010 RepID=UPI003EE59694
MSATITADHKIKDAAELLNTTPASVRKLCPAWELEGKAYKLSDSPKSEWRIPRSTIDEHQRRRAAGQPPVKRLSRSKREALLTGR